MPKMDNFFLRLILLPTAVAIEIVFIYHLTLWTDISEQCAVLHRIQMYLGLKDLVE